MHWNSKGHEIFKRWYIDGRIYFHKLVDLKDTSKGVTEVRYIDPRNIKKIREVSKEYTKDKNTPVQIVGKVRETFLYNDDGLYPTFTGKGVGGTGQGMEISVDSVIYVTSGLFEPTSNQVYSYLHKAIKPVNQLRMIEDAVVIYRISRAPELSLIHI